jgi:enoyl-CoA hydratase
VTGLFHQVANGVLWVELNRPEQRNALSLEVLEELKSVFHDGAGDQVLRCAVLTGRGERSFAAGGDLKELDSMRSADDANRVLACGRAALDAIRAFPTPVIAAINGVAVGGGAELAVACDFRVSVASAKIGFVQGTLNISTAWGGAADLIGILGPTKALELLVSGRTVSANDALELGLVDKVCAEGESLRETADAFVAPWIGRPSHVIRALTAVSRAAKRERRRALENVESSAFLSTWVHEDHWRAAAAALSKSGRR